MSRIFLIGIQILSSTRWYIFWKLFDKRIPIKNGGNNKEIKVNEISNRSCQVSVGDLYTIVCSHVWVESRLAPWHELLASARSHGSNDPRGLFRQLISPSVRFNWLMPRERETVAFTWCLSLLNVARMGNLLDATRGHTRG